MKNFSLLLLSAFFLIIIGFIGCSKKSPSTPESPTTVPTSQPSSPTITPSVTPSTSPAETLTETLTLSPTVTATLTQTVLFPSSTPTVSGTNTEAPTGTITWTNTETAEITETITPTITATVTEADTETVTGTITETEEVTFTTTPTITETAGSAGPTFTVTPISTIQSGSGTWTDLIDGTFDYITGNYLDLEIYNSTPYISYTEGLFTVDTEMRLVPGNLAKHTGGTSWAYHGIRAAIYPGFFSQANGLRCDIDSSDGRPYVIYQDSIHGNKASVYVADAAGTTWNQYGSPAFSSGTISSYRMDIEAENGTVVAAVAETNTISIFRYGASDSDWTSIGSITVAGSALDINIEMHGSDIYVMHWDSGNDTYISKYNGSGWDTIGYFPDANHSGFTVSDGGDLYLTYVNRAGTAETQLFNASVYNGTPGSWTQMGSTNISTDALNTNLRAWGTRICLSDSGGIFAVYEEDDQGTSAARIVLMQYDTSAGDWYVVDTIDNGTTNLYQAYFQIWLKFIGETPYVFYKLGDNNMYLKRYDLP